MATYSPPSEYLLIFNSSFYAINDITQAQADIRYLKLTGGYVQGVCSAKDFALSTSGIYANVLQNAPDPVANNIISILDFGTNSTLETYSSSTWTPTIGDGVNPFTSSLAVGKYTKFQDGHVYIYCKINWTNKGTASGSIIVSLPFTSTNISPLTVGQQTGITQSLLMTGSISSANASLYKCVSGVTSSLLDTDFLTTGLLYFSGFLMLY